MARVVKEHKLEVEKSGEYEYIFTYEKNDILLQKLKTVKTLFVQIKCNYCGSFSDVQYCSFKNRNSRPRCCCHSYENSLQYVFDVNDVPKSIWSNKNTKEPKTIWKSSKKDKVWLCCINKPYHEDYEIDTNHLTRDISKGNYGCPACSSKKVNHYDSFGYKSKEFINNIRYDEKMNKININELYSIALYGMQKYYYVCQVCGNLSEKPYRPYEIINRDFLCDKHKHRLSYPERLMRALLDYKNIKYQIHMVFEWSDKKEYDFYLPNENIIIEMDGRLGHGDKTIGDEDVHRSTFIDNMKDWMAEKHNMQVIRIDCKFLDDNKKFEYISNNIINSELNKYIDIKDIDWDIVKKHSVSSIFLMIIKDYNNNLTINEISKKHHLCRPTIQKYLREAKDLGLCDYDGKNIIRNNGDKKGIKIILKDGSIEYYKSIRDVCNTLCFSYAFYEKYLSKTLLIDIEKIYEQVKKHKGSYQTKKVLDKIQKYDKAKIIKI